MVIREKALVAEMKESYKGGGYTVAAMHNGKTIILCDDWAVQIDDAEVPREALSLMCLHMGFLPEDGDAFTVYKGDKQPIVQRELYENTVHEFEAMERMQEDGPSSILKTVLTYNGYSVWQRTADNHVHLVDRDYESILYKIDSVMMVGNALYAGDAVSKVYIVCDDGMGSPAQLEHMGKTRWTTVI